MYNTTLKHHLSLFSLLNVLGEVLKQNQLIFSVLKVNYHRLECTCRLEMVTFPHTFLMMAFSAQLAKGGVAAHLLSFHLPLDSKFGVPSALFLAN
jgi:hypothetical protein